MNIYVWKSDACRNYGSGTVAAIGGTIDEARNHAFVALTDWAKENKSWLLYLDDELDRWNDFIKIINADLEAEPRIMKAVVVEGSE